MHLTAGSDVTARELQKQESQYTRCKGFDSFAPVGPCIATGLDGEPRGIEGWVNQERRQSSSTKYLIFPIDQLIEFVTFVMTKDAQDAYAKYGLRPVIEESVPKELPAVEQHLSRAGPVERANDV